MALELGRCLLLAGKATEALVVLQPFAGADARSAEASYLTARAFQDSGNPSMAAAHATRAAELAPGNAEYRRLARSLEKGK